MLLITCGYTISPVVKQLLAQTSASAYSHDADRLSVGRILQVRARARARVRARVRVWLANPNPNPNLEEGVGVVEENAVGVEHQGVVPGQGSGARGRSRVGVRVIKVRAA